MRETQEKKSYHGVKQLSKHAGQKTRRIGKSLAVEMVLS